MTANACHEISDAIKAIGNECLSSTLQDQMYHPEDVRRWLKEIPQTCVEKLGKYSDFKFIVSCTILQLNDAGFHTNTCCLWDSETDGSVSCRFENSSLLAILNVFLINTKSV